jgi:hypothetical protein
LRFVAAHRFVLACQVTEWLGVHGVVAYRRLRGLRDAGLLSYRRIFHARPGCYQITRAGLAVVESDLGRPSVDLRSYRHDVGVVWLWLAAWRGSFGAAERVLSERQMRARDQAAEGYGEWFAVPLGGYGPGGQPRVHYPDVALVREDGSRLALELELTLKSRARLEAILVGYAHERRIAGVVYLTDKQPIHAAVLAGSRAVGLDGRCAVEYVAPAPRRDLDRAWQHIVMGERPSNAQ